MRKIMREPGFRILEVRSAAGASKKLLKISYAFRSKEFLFGDGSITVSPSEDWRILADENRLGLQDGPKATREIKYLTDLPVPKTVKIVQPRSVRYFTTIEASASPTPIDEFRLPFFGLPDLERTKPSDSPLSIQFFLFCSIAVCLVLSWSVRRMSGVHKAPALRDATT